VEEEKSLTAKDAEDAKGTMINSTAKPEGREGGAPSVDWILLFEYSSLRSWR
jgi:hypothetical protein